MQPNIVFFTALKCEADLLIAKYKLKKDLSISAYDIYSDKEGSIIVCISGIGNLNMASAVNYVFAAGFVGKFSILVNIGVAGAKEIKIGELVEVNKVAAKKNYYPFSHFKAKFLTANLCNVDEVGFYPDEGMVDMESYGFFFAAIKFVPLEYIALFKIISDNKDADQNKVNQNYVKDLFLIKEQELADIVIMLQKFINSEYELLKDPPEYLELIAAIKFSFSEKNMLKKLVVKLSNTEIDYNLEDLLAFKNANKIIEEMRCLAESI